MKRVVLNRKNYGKKIQDGDNDNQSFYWTFDLLLADVDHDEDDC